MAITQTTSTPYPGIASSFAGGVQPVPRDHQIYIDKMWVYTSEKVNALVWRFDIIETNQNELHLIAGFNTHNLERLTNFFKENGINLKLVEVDQRLYIHIAYSVQDVIQLYQVIKATNYVSKKIDEEINHVFRRHLQRYFAFPQPTSIPYPGIASSFTGGDTQLSASDKEWFKRKWVYTSDKIHALVPKFMLLETIKGGPSFTAYFNTRNTEDLTHYFKQHGIVLKLVEVAPGLCTHSANSARDAMDFYLVIKNANNVPSEIDQEVKRILLRPRL